jgi:hypothetical protein
MKTLRDYINIVDGKILNEGIWSNLKTKMEFSAARFDLKQSIWYLDELISKAKQNNINSSVVGDVGYWLNIVEIVWRSKDPILKKLLDKLELNLRHWPEKNSDVQRSKQLIQQLAFLQQKIKEYGTANKLDESTQEDSVNKIYQLFKETK